MNTSSPPERGVSWARATCGVSTASAPASMATRPAVSVSGRMVILAFPRAVTRSRGPHRCDASGDGSPDAIRSPGIRQMLSGLLTRTKMAAHPCRGGSPMTDYREIRYEVEEQIATITFNRPEHRNPISVDMLGEVRSAARAAEQDDDVRVLVITGAGKAFCSGGDV